MKMNRYSKFKLRFAPFGLLLLYSALLFQVAGCGDGRGVRIPVSGKVTIDGNPVAFGSVTFMPVTGVKPRRPGGGSIESDGTFQISSFTPKDGLYEGEYRVMILAIEPINDLSQRWHAPQKYSSIKTSGLKAEITGSKTEVNFELSWEGSEHSEPFVEKF